MPSCRNHPDAVTDLLACTRCGAAFCSNCIITLQGKAVCAGCKGEQVKDITSGVSQDADLASRGARLAGSIVDSLIITVPTFVIALVVGLGIGVPAKEPGTLWGATDWVFQFAYLAVAMAYEALLLKARAQTLGKMATKTAVVSEDGTPLTTRQCWLRSISRGVLAVTQIGGLIDALMIFSNDRRTLHDRIARTRVVNWKR